MDIAEIGIEIAIIIEYLHLIKIRHAFGHFFCGAPGDVTFLLGSVIQK